MLIRSEAAALREIIAGLEAGLFLARPGPQGLELVYANPVLEGMCGYAAGKLQGQNFSILCPTRATLTEYQQFHNLANLQVAGVRLRCQRKDGSLFWASLSLKRQPARFKGQAVEYVGVLHDISAQATAEQGLVQSATRQQLILDGIGSPVLGLTQDMQILFCNEAYAQFVNRNVEDLTGQNLLELFPSFKQRRSYAVYQQVLATGQAQALEGRMGEKYIHTVVYPTPWGILAIAEDYSERRQFEDELLNRDRLLLGFAQASALLASGARDTRLINLALAELGKSAHVDRVYLLENSPESNSTDAMSFRRYEWSRDGVPGLVEDSTLRGLPLEKAFPRWFNVFERGAPVYGLSRHFPEQERLILERQGALSVLAVPVLIQRRVWGFLGFDDCTRPREWRQSEIGVLLAAAASIGGAIARQDAETRLIEERSLLQQVIDSIPDLVYYKHLDNTYLGCNAAFTRFAGQPKENIIGKSDTELFAVEQAGKLYESDRLALEHHGARHTEDWVAYPDGRRVLLDTVKVPFCDASGQMIGVLGVSRDITEHRATEQMQREFVDNASHELRTPITALLGLAETLQRPDLSSEAQRQLLGSIEGQALRLARLVDDILALSNLELAEQTMRRDRVDLRQVGIGAFDALHSVAQEKRLRYEIENDDHVVQVIGDQALLEMLISNLLTNAIRYTPEEGRVELRVFARQEHALVQVTDTGIGIEPEVRERIFERFFREDKARSRALGGTGLGLAIVSQVAALHAAEISVESTPGVGSIFTAAFPLFQDVTLPL